MMNLFIALLTALAIAYPLDGAAFSPGKPQSLSIASLDPISELLAVTEAAPKVNVAIQAGHWKSNELPAPLARLRDSTGASGGGRTEAQVTVDIAQRAATLLRDKGLTVEVLPATVPTGYKADLFIALHADGSSGAQPRGYKVSTRWRSEVAALDALLVQSIEDSYDAVTKMPRDANITPAMRGYYAYSTYRGEEYRLGDATPAAILEMGFMSNSADRALMFNNPDVVARGVVAGINNFYAQRAEGLRLQTATESQAAASPYGLSAVIFSNSVNIRAGTSTDALKLDSADFGDSFPLQQAATPHPRSSVDSKQGAQVVAGSGWYKISLLEITGDAYVSRDFVVVQQ